MATVSKDNIKSLLQAARYEEAKILCQKLCRQNDQDAEAWFLLGTACGQLRDYDSSIQGFLRSVAIQGNVAITHHNLGLVYLRAGRPALARSSLATALGLEPGSVAIRLELANAMQAAGSPEEAIPVYESILEFSPGTLAALTNLALAYASAGMPGKAISTCKILLALQGDTPETLFVLGNAYRLAGQHREAEETYRSVLRINPDLGGVLNNLGLVLSEQGSKMDAEFYFRKSLDVEPRQYDAYINLANCLQDQRNASAAREILEKALVIYAEKPELHWDYSLVLLKLGLFEEGWDEYEWRLLRIDLTNRETPLPSWHGENLAGKTILVTAEQGIGDEIMFSSCYQDLARQGAHLIIDCEGRLAPLFRRSFPGCDIRSGKQTDNLSRLGDLSGIDVHISAGSIPRFLRRDRGAFPSHNGYLSADPACVEKWRRRYAAIGSHINVGLSWKGGHVSKMVKRSSSIKDWLPVLELTGINFINLQYGDIRSDIETAKGVSPTAIHHWHDSDPLKNMDDFAAQISALDLVISVDNSTVHLAGALAVRTWLLQPYNPDWRWLEYSTDCYWYPEVEQFHPATPDGWNTMLYHVATRLGDFAASVTKDRGD